MARTKSEENVPKTAGNVLQKLARARLEFLDQKISKSGVNRHLEFHYFELEDIVPAAIRIFAGLGLATRTVMDGQTASMLVLNADDPDEDGVEFTLPYRENKPIVSNAGREVTNPMQALGASVTYLRRYLWMLALDVTEPDGVAPNVGAEVPNGGLPETAKNPRSAPPDPERRTAVREELTGPDGPADPLLLAALKAACKALREADPDQEDLVQQIALKTNGFTAVTRAACEALVERIGQMVAELTGGTEGGGADAVH